MAMYAGMANFGSMSVTNLSKDLRIELEKSVNSDSYTLEEVANYAIMYFQKEYKKSHTVPNQYHSFEFWIGGYSHGNKHGEIWKFEIRYGQWINPVQLVQAETSNRILWGGQIQAISRLLLGCDPQIVQTMNLDADKLSKFHTPLVDASMPVQDAIDLADFLVDMTKKYFAFLPGADIVAGDTDIATVTKHEGFKWIRRKHYYSSQLNRRETDHATQ